MSKFKVGDVVQRVDGFYSRPWNVFQIKNSDKKLVVTKVSKNGYLQINGYTGVSGDDQFPFHPMYFEVESSSNEVGISWDFAEAAKLKKLADDAILAYNKYLELKPDVDFHPYVLKGDTDE